jgi:hypothetical protein
MNSDAERRRLAEIESSLQADDPAFVRRFTSGRRQRRRTVLLSLVLVGAVTITVVALVYRNVPMAVLGLAAIGASVGIWITRRGT